MKAIIFGINGQDGQYLSRLLLEQEIEVTGVSRGGGDHLQGDVSDFGFVSTLISRLQPDYIFHLAANSTVRHDAIFENHATISTGTFNILESALKQSPKSKIFLSGSALQFVNNGSPVSEQNAFEALNPYAVSRIQSVYAARYFRTLGLQVYVGYFFHHDSPLRPDRHINMKIAQTALRIAAGSDEILEIGNVDVVKEYNYAGDVVAAIWKLVNQQEFFEAVIGSGKGYSIREWIEICFNNVSLDWKKHFRPNPAFKAEFSSLISDPGLILSTGWKPLVGIEELATKMMAV